MDRNELFGQPNTWMNIHPIEELIKDETEELKGTLESCFLLAHLADGETDPQTSTLCLLVHFPLHGSMDTF